MSSLGNKRSCPNLVVLALPPVKVYPPPPPDVQLMWPFSWYALSDSHSGHILMIIGVSDSTTGTITGISSKYCENLA